MRTHDRRGLPASVSPPVARRRVVMSMGAAVLTAALAACGGKASPAPGNSAARATAVPCPAGDALAELAIASWGRGPGDVIPICGALVVGGRPLWVVSGFLERASDDERVLSEWTAIVTPTGEVLSVTGDEDLPPAASDHRTNEEWFAVDLDGDGDDELLNISGYAHMGFESSSMRVARVRDGKYVPVEGHIDLDDNNSAAVDPDDPETGAEFVCTGAWKLVPADRGQHIEVAYQGTGPCERTGRFTWKLDGDRLVEAR